MDQSQLKILLQLFPWIFPAGTLAMTWVAYRKHRRWIDAPKNRADAEIVRYETERDPDDSSVSYHPVYRFRTSLGQTVEAREMMPGNHRPAVGSEIAVYYDQNNPDQVSARDTAMPWWGWVMLAVVNAVSAGLAWFMSSSL